MAMIKLTNYIDTERESRKLRKALTELTEAVRRFLADLDTAMAVPSSAAKGQRIAGLANDLNLANDLARHFGLGLDLRTGRKRTKKEATS